MPHLFKNSKFGYNQSFPEVIDNLDANGRTLTSGKFGFVKYSGLKTSKFGDNQIYGQNGVITMLSTHS